MVCLMYVAHQDRWIDISLRNLTGDWLRRIEGRFAGVNGGLKLSILQSFNQLDRDNPTTFGFRGLCFISLAFRSVPEKPRHLFLIWTPTLKFGSRRFVWCFLCIVNYHFV